MEQKIIQTEEEFLANYNPKDYDRPSVTVDMLVFTVNDVNENNYRKLPGKALRLLMIQRGGHPHLGKWAIPGGFVEMDENLDEAAARELKEETNIDDIYLEQLYTYGDVGRDPRSRVISVAYLSLVDSKLLDIQAMDDAAAANWFTVAYQIIEESNTKIDGGMQIEKQYQLILESDSHKLEAIIKYVTVIKGKSIKNKIEILQADGIAFDHAKIIAYAIEQLRIKAEQSNIVFQLMPEEFTLTQLQLVYETILDKKLQKANFRRKILPMVSESGQFTKNEGHRPSKLYHFNPKAYE